MNTPRLGARLMGVALMSFIAACERGEPSSARSASSITGFSASASAPTGASHIRWDIVSINFATGAISAGGVASARAADGLKITITGEGTFVAPAGGSGTSSAATGGGTWQTFNASGVVTARGTYEVTGLVRWEQAASSLGPGAPDLIDDPARSTARLAVLRVEYSDGSRGTVVISCRITAFGVFEGVTASKGFVGYWNREAPAPVVDANRTLFHVLD